MTMRSSIRVQQNAARFAHTMRTATRSSSTAVVVVVVQLLLVCCVIERVTAPDPEFELHLRSQQVLNAIVNTLLRPNANNASASQALSFRCRSTAPESQFARLTVGDPRIVQQLDLSAPLAILIHGWFDGHDRTWFNRTASAYQRYVGGNFCILDWGALAETKYSLAAQRTRYVAERLVRFLRHVRKLGIPMGRVTLIGHSFGAQIAGMAGRRLRGTVGRIFGLDPAGWMFTKPQLLDERVRLDRSDAVYVQCVHTARSTLGLGSGVECGHQDFYPNDGFVPQPGCVRPREEGSITLSMFTCSHYKSVQYFTESLNPANRFKAWPCARGYDNWERGLCSGKTFDYMGVHSRNRIGGKLFLRTAVQAPYVAD